MASFGLQRPDLALTASSRHAVIRLLTEVKQPHSPVVLTGVRDPLQTSGDVRRSAPEGDSLRKRAIEACTDRAVCATWSRALDHVQRT